MPAATKRARAGTKSNPIVISDSKRRRTTKGYVRTSGNYGRFQGTMRGSEKKWFDTAATAGAIATTGTVISPSINLLSAGTGESQLIGRNCVIKSIQMRADILSAATSDAALANVVPDDFVRIYMVLDKQANGAAATVAQMFQNTDIRTMNDLENSKRFKILKEFNARINKVVSRDEDNDLYFCGNATMPLEPCYMKVNIPLEFGATPSGAITDVRSNNIFLIGFSRSGTVTINWRTRIRYSDN